MQSKQKANSIITHTLDGNIITFNVVGAGSFVVDMAKLSEANRMRAAVHGVIQRVSDGGAISRDQATGRAATPEEKYQRMAAIGMHLESGADEWSMRREGGGNEGSLLFRALRLAYPNKPADVLKTFLGGKTTTQKNALIASDTLKPFVDKLRSEAGAGLNGEEILKGL